MGVSLRKPTSCLVKADFGLRPDPKITNLQREVYLPVMLSFPPPQQAQRQADVPVKITEHGDCQPYRFSRHFLAPRAVSCLQHFRIASAPAPHLPPSTRNRGRSASDTALRPTGAYHG
jgi:hypothetical protein